MSAESSSTTSTPSTLTTQEKIDRGLECKLQGNRFYKDGNVKEALSKWHESLLYCAGINSFSGMYGSKSTESENKAATRLVSDVQNNLSAYYISKELYEKASASSMKVLTTTPNSLKALYRCGLANLKLRNLHLAAAFIGKALDYAPEDPKIIELATELVKVTEATNAAANAEDEAIPSQE